MSGIFNRISLMISRYLSNRLFMREQGILLGIMACMLTVGAFSAAFINTFLYSFANATNSDGLYTVVKYNMLSAVSMIVFCVVVGILAKRITYKASMTIGAVLHIIYYICIITFAKNIQEHIGVIAMLSGVSTAFFYVAYNALVTSMIGSVLRKQYVMFQSIVSAAVGVLFPVLSGAIIYAILSVSGYIAVFAVCVIISSACLILCFMVPKLRGQSRRTYFAGVLLKSFLSGRYFAVSMCDCLRGLKEGIIMFLLPVIILRATDNVFIVGVYVSGCTLSMISGSLFSQKTDQMRYPYVHMLGAILLQAASAIAMVFKINVWSMFAFGVVNSFLIPLCTTPVNVEYYNALSNVGANLAKKTMETTCVKEIYYNLGKIIAILFLSLTITNTVGMFILIAVFFVLQVVTWIVCVVLRKATYANKDL